MPINLQTQISGQAQPTPEPRSVVSPRQMAAVPRQALPPDGKSVPPEADAKKPVTENDVFRAVRSLNDHAQDLQRSLQFRVDEESGSVVVKIMDTKTNEVIRQIPSQEALDMANSLRMTEGLLLHARA